ncbi:hypothetical protein GGF41_007113 [Coemansia sp. RSA 2531]|nr:hypothetical protein GGF41_007113 [Coemansia sp. RSA 2531]
MARIGRLARVCLMPTAVVGTLVVPSARTRNNSSSNNNRNPSHSARLMRWQETA